MPDIVISEPMHEAAVHDLGRSFEVRYDHALARDGAALSGAVADARALIVRDRTIIDADLLDAAPRLRVIGCLGACAAQVDLEACRARGIEIHAYEAGAEQTPVDRVVAGLVRLLGRSGWTPGGGDRTLGLVGFNPVAREVAGRARALGLTVWAYDPLVDSESPLWADLGVHPTGLLSLLESCDAVSLHLRLTDETRELIDWETITEMRPGAVLINASHPGLVDNGAVIGAVRTGRLAGALLDLEEGDSEPELDTRNAADARIGALIAHKVRTTLERREEA
ncbi:3-phosphoglycerate dehydrogenase [Skermanella mucosa]|uniref:NAD(P)-dependent oxidoreductase n=1 Tax=Skermanella mucosa TaxID=1789672 RepID=UPI00192BEEA6|nr:NAD(P)-dependent oxidoreductase [Skermanella mucosa]UEM23776.1 3-phosphoglycerate dehydrogenase [Skermanella mucosa]